MLLMDYAPPVRRSSPGEAYAAKLAAARVPVTLQRGEGVVHGSQEMDGVLPDVAAAYREEVTRFLRSAFSGNASEVTLAG